ncbi:MAG: site-specific DNA-methyltransferase [Chloroflexi bacterium]|nr:site-specific DNA-methyltransferase [Chloroflexota bacterium]
MGHANWADKTLFTGDNLPILRGMNSESVDLIYLDPPFNSKTNYAAPIGSKAAGAAFKDTWSLSDIDVEWINLLEAKHLKLWRVLMAAMTPSDKSYLAYMAARLLELKRVLKSTGSIYLHCDPTMSHYLKLLMDAIFGRKHFRNEIVWRRHAHSHSLGSKQWPAIYDVLLMYSGSDSWTWNTPYVPYSAKYITQSFRHQDTRGKYQAYPLTGARPGGGRSL